MNASDNYTTLGTAGTFMDEPRYKEFPQTVTLPGTVNIYGFWTNNLTTHFGGNSRRASYYGSGNNTGAHVQFYCTVYEPGHYVVYHHMNSGNSTTNAYVKFYRFGEPSPVDSFRYSMLENNVLGGSGGSWKPLGIIELFPSDSALTVEIGLDSLSGNTLRADAIALVRSTQSGPDLEFGNRRFSRVVIDGATGDTLASESFYRDRAPLAFAETTFKFGVFTDKKIPLYNLGGSPLIVSGFSTQTSRFSVVTPTPFTIPVGGMHEITVRFDPLGEETTFDTLLVMSNDGLEPEPPLPIYGTGKFVTPLYVNPDPALGDTQRVTNINLRGVQTNFLWVRFGGNVVFTLNGGGQTVVRMTNPNQGGDYLRADLLRVRLVPIVSTITTSLDDKIPPKLLNFSSVSIYDAVGLSDFTYQKTFTISSNG